jgi:alpha-beta hydrolase superfamily lysophospholipase
MSITHSETDFEGAGLTLYRQSWLPEGAARAVLAVVHGYAEHSGRYDWAGRRLAEAGYAVHAYDLRGHGRSPGDRTLVKSFREHLDDLDRFLAVLHADDPRPPFLVGHSMGGLIAALYVTTRTRPLAGVILSGPALGPVPWSARLLSPVTALAAKASPGFGMRQLDAATVSRDPEVVAAYASDPLVYHGKMPAATTSAATRAIDTARRRASVVTIAVLVMHGSEDELTEHAGSAWWCEHTSSTDKTFRLWDGLAHEILNEPEKEAVFAELRAWLDARA